MRGCGLAMVAVLAVGGCGSGTADTEIAATTTAPPSSAMHCEKGELVGVLAGDVAGDYAAPAKTPDDAFNGSPGGQAARASSNQSVSREPISASQIRYAVRTDGKVRLRMVVEKAPRGGWVVTTVERCEREGSGGG